MTTADLTALRAQACQVIAELGQALACLEDAEGLLNPNGFAALQASYVHGQLAMTACSALAHERVDTACGSLETAAAHLADLITATDRAATTLAPQGDQP